jgi:hypothetical protein
MAPEKTGLMKKKAHLSKMALVLYWALLPWCLSAQAPDPYTGMWEGNFMEQFKTVILLDRLADSEYAGKILMFSGENRIQDDELKEISIQDRQLSFYIPAKETSFHGTFDESNTELAGNFIFPDKSRHPLKVRKYEKDSLALEAELPSVKEKLKHAFPAEELKSEFRELIDKLKRYHPRLHAHIPQSSFELLSKDILESMDAELSLEQYYVKIAPLVASIKCSHTGIRLPIEYQVFLEEKGLFFPLKLYIHDQKAWLLSTPGKAGVELEAGCEITAINGIPVDKIIDELLGLIPAEAFGTSTRYQELNRNFHHYFHMLDPSGQFHIDFIASGSRGMIELDALPYPVVCGEGPSMNLPPYSFHMHDNPETGILKISSFGIRDMEDYFAFLDAAFVSLKEAGTGTLLLDLRDNQGGHPIFAAQLFSYLTPHDFTYFERNPDVVEFEPLYNPMHPNPNKFSGNLYVLVNGACLSTSGHLISLLKYHTNALFIGEEPGSSFTCNDHSIQLKLAQTGMEVNIPRTTFRTAVKGFKEDASFPLDHKVEVTVQDLLSGRDCYTDLVFQLINQDITGL